VWAPRQGWLFWNLTSRATGDGFLPLLLAVASIVPGKREPMSSEWRQGKDLLTQQAVCESEFGRVCGAW